MGLLLGCERLRKLLSQLNDASIMIENVLEDGDKNFKMNRKELGEMCAPLLSKLNKMMQSTLDNANNKDVGAKLDDSSLALGAALIGEASSSSGSSGGSEVPPTPPVDTVETDTTLAVEGNEIDTTPTPTPPTNSTTTTTATNDLTLNVDTESES